MSKKNIVSFPRRLCKRRSAACSSGAGLSARRKRESIKRWIPAFAGMTGGLFIWPLIVFGGRLATRVVLNLWQLIEQ